MSGRSPINLPCISPSLLIAIAQLMLGACLAVRIGLFVDQRPRFLKASPGGSNEPNILIFQPNPQVWPTVQAARVALG